MIWLAVCRRVPGGIPTIQLVPDDEAQLVCHKLFKWPIQGRTRPELRTYDSVAEAVIDLAGAGYSGDLLAVAEALEAELLL